MFKSKNVADEVYKSMRSLMVKQARSAKDQKIEKLSEIIDCINKAAELSDEVGLKTEAEVLTCLLSKIAGAEDLDAYDPARIQKLLDDELNPKEFTFTSILPKKKLHDADIKMRPLKDKNHALDVDDFTKGYDFGTRGSEVFLDGDGHIFCKDCAKQNEDNIASGEIHMEGHPISCEGCGLDIPSMNGVDPSEMAVEDENYAKSKSKKEPLDDYEPCGDCGFDHSYEQQEAYDWHKKHKNLDENYAMDKINELMSEEQLPADYEQCSECGFDHEYETDEAWKAHEAMGKFEPKEPSEYQECPDCGLDHNEDPAGAINWHSTHNRLKKKL